MTGTLADLLGGPRSARVVVVLAAALGLQSADFATVAATADDLKQEFGVGNTAIGLLISLVALIGAVATLPIGVVVDRVPRTRLLAISILVWAVAMVFAAVARSFPWLLAARAALGAVTATAGPAVASLTGDYFPARSRGRMWGFILVGELVGTAIGFVISGEIAALVDWRAAFWWLAIPSSVLAWAMYRLPEPARGGQRPLRPVDVVTGRGAGGRRNRDAADGAESSVARAARRKHVPADPRLVLHEDPTGRSLWWAVGYVLRIRTNVVFVLASAMAYFFFSGVQSFGLVYVMSHYGVPKPMASAQMLVVGAGAVAGVYWSGWFSDHLLGRGVITARVLVPAAAMLCVTPVLVPALLASTMAIALPLLAVGAGLLGAGLAPLDAGRLDIMHPALWGRAEGVRTVLRGLAQAAAPVLFGLLSETVFGRGDSGLQETFLAALGAVLLAGALALIGLRTYPRDVATAHASAERAGTGGGRGCSGG